MGSLMGTNLMLVLSSQKFNHYLWAVHEIDAIEGIIVVQDWMNWLCGAFQERKGFAYHILHFLDCTQI